jgi:electron transfer flavoprotein beta subunit
MSLESLGIDTKTKVEVKKMSMPAGRSGGKKVENVAALVQALQNEAKVI